MKKSELLLRRILSFVLVAVTVLSFAACGGDENEGVVSGEDTGAIADASVSEGESSVAESTEEIPSLSLLATCL